MTENTTIVNFTDLLGFATTIGYDWNQAHNILVDAIQIFPEHNWHRNFEADELEEEGFPEDAKKIIGAFMEKHQLTWFHLCMDR